MLLLESCAIYSTRESVNARIILDNSGDPIRSPGLSVDAVNGHTMIVNRLNRMRTCRLLVVLATASAVGTSGPAARAAAPPSKPQRPRPPAADRAPGEESLSERRAVRGVPVDDVGDARDARAARAAALRGAGVSAHGAPTPPAARTARCRRRRCPDSWGGSGDVPPELRSPAPPRGSGATPAPDSDWLRALKLPDFPVRWDPQVLRYLDYFKNDPKGRAVMSNWLRRAGRYRDAVRQGAGAPRLAARSLLPGDDRERLRERGALARRRRAASGSSCPARRAPTASRSATGSTAAAIPSGRPTRRRATSRTSTSGSDPGTWCSPPTTPATAPCCARSPTTTPTTTGSWSGTSPGCPGSRASTCRRSWRPRSSAATRRRSGSRDVTPDPPFAYEEVEVPAGTTLATVARAAGAKTEVIEALNPHLLREPHAARSRARRACASRPGPPPSTPRTSTSARGDRRQARHGGAAFRRDAGRRRAGARRRACASCGG